MASERPIFLLGCPRSGTTLLSTMLHAHPHIAMPPETRFLLPVYEHRARFGDLRVAANRRRLARRITNQHTHFDDLRLDRQRVIDAIVAAPPTLGSAFGCVWQEFARDRGKRRWGEKRPAYWREVDVVLRLFPDAQLVHLVRDPRACVASLQQVRWWHRGVPGSASLWVSADRELERAAARLPADTYHRLRYEDLIGDPRGTLTALCAYLEEDFAPSMLEHARPAADIVPARKSWHERVHGPVDERRVQAWRESLTPEQIGLVESVAAARMARHGYRRSGLAARPRPQDVAGYAATQLRTRVGIVQRRWSDARLRRRVPMPLAMQR